jgi:glycosyltransferase involved in cell wall biosynthesis
MKVCIATKYENWSCENTGKGKFLKRLSVALQELGVKIVTPHEKSDINLAVGKNAWPVNATKNIIRLGDTHKYKKDYRQLNKRKIKALHKADGVIYQSRYSQKLCQAFLGVAKCPSIVIYNGADPKEFEVEPMKSPYDTNFLASARKWDNNKRLKTIKRAFWEANIEKSCLWVCGDTGHKNGGVYDPEYDREIRMLGLVDDKTLASLYRRCNAMIDITYLSACPNSVVEALNADCKVICTDQGGTHEIVSVLSDFAVIPEKVKYNFKPTGKYVPNMDVDAVSKNIKYYSHFGKSGNWKVGKCEHIHIDNIAKQYLEFFERILERSNRTEEDEETS